MLFLSNMVPYPLEDGGNALTLPALKALCSQHEVHLLSFIDSDRERAYLPELRKICISVDTVPKIIRMGRIPFMRHFTVLKSLLSRDAYFIYQFRSKAMRRKVREIIASQHFDLIHVDHLCMAPFAEKVPGTLRVLQEHNVEYLSVLRFSNTTKSLLEKTAARIDQRKLKAFETHVCSEMDGVTVLSEVMGEEIHDMTKGEVKIAVVDCGVDETYWKPSEDPYDLNTISFLGNMNYPPNTHGALWFAREVFPIIQQRVPDAKFQIIGSDPPREIRNLCNYNGGVVVTGFVPDVRPFLASSAVSIFPIFYGGGIKIKLLVSLSMGIPAVSTRMGSEGIGVESERSVLFADDPETFAQKVLEVMTDPRLRASMSQEGRHLVEDRYRQEIKHRRILEVYDAFADAARSDPGNG